MKNSSPYRFFTITICILHWVRCLHQCPHGQKVLPGGMARDLALHSYGWGYYPKAFHPSSQCPAGHRPHRSRPTEAPTWCRKPFRHIRCPEKHTCLCSGLYLGKLSQYNRTWCWEFYVNTFYLVTSTMEPHGTCLESPKHHLPLLPRQTGSFDSE